jgi:hypothetical protein
MGIIQASHSLDNFPIFVVPKQNGAFLYMLYYRVFNANSVNDKYTMRTIEELVDTWYKGSNIFTSLDLKDGFYQLPLDKNGRPLGLFMFYRSSMGTQSSLAQLQGMLEVAIKGLTNVVVYFDDLLSHSKSHALHRVHLSQG